MKTSRKQIFIVAGEPSGDLLGGYLAEALSQHYPTYSLQGVGGKHMRQAHVDTLVDAEPLAMIGFTEIITKLPLICKTMRFLMDFLKKNPPDLLILIDYPGFNLRLAAKARTLGIKVMYYVSPQIWAWHYSRIKKIKKNVDLMAVLFPFEEKIYANAGVPVKFVGHPIIEKAKPDLSKKAAYEKFSLDASQPIIAVLPGSRHREVQTLLPDMLTAIQSIKQQKPDAQFVLPLAPNLSPTILSSFSLNAIKVIENNTYNVLQLCDAAIVASGTATLEVAVLGVPQVIIYRLNALTYQLAKRLANVKYFGLCNIVAEQPIALELIQNQVKTKSISDEIITLLDDQHYRQQIQKKISHLKQKLLTNNASLEVARAAIMLIENRITR